MSNTIQASDLEFTPTGEGLGLEVRGLSLSGEPTEDVVTLLKLKLAESGVLIFRDQEVSEQEQLRFTRCFGETQGHPILGVGGSNPNPDADPEVFYLTNAVEGYQYENADEKEKKKNRGEMAPSKSHPERERGELGWHTDLQYMPEPQVYSLLFGIETPKEGAETEWANLTAAYDALSDEMKEKLAPLGVIHWYSRRIPQVTHPAVRTHPITGRKALYISPGLSRLIEGWGEEESKALIREISEHSTQRQFTYVHKWKPGDALMWDNRCTLHRRHGFDIKQRRIVRRTQTVGEPVVA